MGLFDNFTRAFQDFGHQVEHTFEDVGNQIDTGFNDTIVNPIVDISNQIDMGFNNDIIKPVIDITNQIDNTVQNTILPDINIGLDHIKDPVSIENTYKEVGNLIGDNIDKSALQKSVGYIYSGLQTIPVVGMAFTGLNMAVDLGTSGSMTNYLNDGQAVNGTISFLPGMNLAQKILNDSSGGASGDFLTSNFLDPKKDIMNDIHSIIDGKGVQPINIIPNWMKKEIPYMDQINDIPSILKDRLNDIIPIIQSPIKPSFLPPFLKKNEDFQNLINTDNNILPITSIFPVQDDLILPPTDSVFPLPSNPIQTTVDKPIIQKQPFDTKKLIFPVAGCLILLLLMK